MHAHITHSYTACTHTYMHHAHIRLMHTMNMNQIVNDWHARLYVARCACTFTDLRVCHFRAKFCAAAASTYSAIRSFGRTPTLELKFDATPRDSAIVRAWDALHQDDVFMLEAQTVAGVIWADTLAVLGNAYELHLV